MALSDLFNGTCFWRLKGTEVLPTKTPTGWHFNAFTFGAFDAFSSFFMRENVGWMIKIKYLDEREWMVKREIGTKINKGTEVLPTPTKEV